MDLLRLSVCIFIATVLESCLASGESKCVNVCPEETEPFEASSDDVTDNIDVSIRPNKENNDVEDAYDPDMKGITMRGTDKFIISAVDDDKMIMISSLKFETKRARIVKVELHGPAKSTHLHKFKPSKTSKYFTVGYTPKSHKWISKLRIRFNPTVGKPNTWDVRGLQVCGCVKGQTK